MPMAKAGWPWMNLDNELNFFDKNVDGVIELSEAPPPIICRRVSEREKVSNL